MPAGLTDPDPGPWNPAEEIHRWGWWHTAKRDRIGGAWRRTVARTE